MECPICYDEMVSGTVHKTACGHEFHTACFSRWSLQKSSTACPMCRTLVEIRAPTIWMPQLCCARTRKGGRCTYMAQEGSNRCGIHATVESLQSQIDYYNSLLVWREHQLTLRLAS
jgi:transcription elongation factor Elf1